MMYVEYLTCSSIHKQYTIYFLPQMSQAMSNGTAIDNGYSAPKVRFSLEENEGEQTETVEVELDGMEQGPDNVFSMKQDPSETS